MVMAMMCIMFLVWCGVLVMSTLQVSPTIKLQPEQ